MRLKSKLSLLIILLFVIISCKKSNIELDLNSRNENIPIVQQKKCFISKVSLDKGYFLFKQLNDTMLERGFMGSDSVYHPNFRYIYKNGRLESTLMSPDTTRPFIQYFYNDSIITCKYFNHGVIYRQVEYYINTKGFLIGENVYYIKNNTEKILRESYLHIPDSIGNIVESKVLLNTDPLGEPNGFTGIIKNKYDNNINYFKFLPYLDRLSFSKNNISESAYIERNGNISNVEKFNYEYSPEGQPIKRVSRTGIENYTYSCK